MMPPLKHGRNRHTQEFELDLLKKICPSERAPNPPQPANLLPNFDWTTELPAIALTPAFRHAEEMNRLPGRFLHASRQPSRRQFLAASAAAGLGLFWTDWLRAATGGLLSGKGKAKSVILIFNCGAPSHIDLWDMKPAAPDNIRGPFKPIATNVHGIQVSELMPHVARHADKLAIVRTVHHRHTQHNSGMYWSIVGRPYRLDSTLINPSHSDVPSFGTLAGWLARRDGYSGPVPPYVITPAPHCDSLVYITPGQFGGCLGASYDPFVLNSDPNAPNFRVPNLGLAGDLTPGRLADRRA